MLLGLLEEALSCAAAATLDRAASGEVWARLREVEVPQVQSITRTTSWRLASIRRIWLRTPLVLVPRARAVRIENRDIILSSLSLLAVTCSVSGRCTEFKVQYGKVHGVDEEDEEPVRFDIFLAKVDVDRTNPAENCVTFWLRPVVLADLTQEVFGVCCDCVGDEFRNACLRIFIVFSCTSEQRTIGCGIFRIFFVPIFRPSVAHSFCCVLSRVQEQCQLILRIVDIDIP